MKTVWLQKNSARELVLFFNGWGMDERTGAHLLQESDGFLQDLLVCHDYHTLQLPEEIFDDISHYAHITLVAWSFGVWAAQQVELPPVARSIAINGTLFPVNAEKGIHPDTFRATRASWSEENQGRFYRRMCGSKEELALFSTMAPDRSVIHQQEELGRLEEYVLCMGAMRAPWSYDHAIIGGRDLVFPSQQQFTAWKGVPRTVISDMAHFPFFHFRNLQEVLACLST